MEIAHLNIRSIIPKFNDFKNLLTSKEYLIFAISETWLSDNIKDEAIYIPGYNLIRNDRGTRGGGVAFYIHSSLSYTIITTSSDIEQLWVSVSLENVTYAVGVVYKPPTVSHTLFTDKLEESLALCMLQSQHILCVGDVNINFFDQISPSYRYISSMLDSTGMHQIINEATHISSNSMSLIDVIICSEPSLVVSYAVENTDMSDHELISCKIAHIKPKLQPFIYTYRSFKNFNENLFHEDLQNLSLTEIYYIRDVDQKLSVFNKKLLALFDKHIPIKKSRITKAKCPWLNDEIKDLIKGRNKAKAKFRKCPNQAKWDIYKAKRNEINQRIARAKKEYFSSVAQSKDQKNIWKELKFLDIKQSKKFEIPSRFDNVDSINNHFIDSIPVTTVDYNLISGYLQNQLCESSFQFKLIDSDCILWALGKIKNVSAGADGISISLIKLCVPFIVPFLVHITNTILLEGKFPACWKTAYICPVPKLKDIRQLSDLRPISILPGLSKVVEKIIENQLRQHFNDYNILPDTQSGFRPYHSCTTALLNVTDDIIQAHDENKCTALVTLDFSKAFDTINHQVLLAILKSCGILYESLELLRSYLSNRSQIVRLKGKLSHARSVINGVPQGSILGPLLFIVYTSQFIKSLESCESHIYADDTQIYHSFYISDWPNAEMKINSDLAKISDIAKNHSLQLNPKKSKVILFGKAGERAALQQNMSIRLNNIKLNTVNSMNNLGLVIDNDLRFREHITATIKKAYGALRLLYPHKNALDVHTKRMLSDSLVLSQFSYCAPVYGPCIDNATSARIQRVQNSCIRFIYGIRRYDRVSYKLKELDWLNMAGRRKALSLCLYHKLIYTKKPTYLYNKIRFRTDVHNVNVRSKGLISAPHHRTTFCKRGFKYNLYKEYNDIPLYLKEKFNVKQFKFALKEYLLSIV
nr:unnamed protein product [Callosobruchus chinensis]